MNTYVKIKGVWYLKIEKGNTKALREYWEANRAPYYDNMIKGLGEGPLYKELTEAIIGRKNEELLYLIDLLIGEDILINIEGRIILHKEVTMVGAFVEGWRFPE